jgi:PAS domain S-box-containing protein
LNLNRAGAAYKLESAAVSAHLPDLVKHTWPRSSSMQVVTEKSHGSASGAPDAHDLEQVLARTGEAVIIKDLNAVVTFWNREAEVLYGFSANEAVGQSLRKLHLADLSHAAYVAILERVRAGIPTSSFADRRTKSGDVIRVALKTAPLRDAHGTIVAAPHGRGSALRTGEP